MLFNPLLSFRSFCCSSRRTVIIYNFPETIGDGYLVVSGLPNRNGDRHVEEIAKLSFAFMNAVAMFRIDHLPKERVNLRIGFHTGKIILQVFD